MKVRHIYQRTMRNHFNGGNTGFVKREIRREKIARKNRRFRSLWK